jgi:iron(III) transport system ATP-binding protein
VIATPYLRLLGVSKDYGNCLAVNNVSLDVHVGEFVCFLGPSGCGKTTLLRIIAGLDPQTGGRVEIGGRDVGNLPPAARDYGIVFQSYALFPNLSVAKNIAYGLKGQDKEAVRSRVVQMLDLVGLPDIGGKYPTQLSGGQQQRVALARALAPAPKLLLLDEPLSALDARVRLHLRRQIKELHQRLGVTTIMVTHDQEEALTMADRIVVMSQGVIEQVGTPDHIYGHPVSPFVADFVGAMNFLSGIYCRDGRVRLGDFELECSGEAEDGAPVTICLRPEDVVVRSPAEGLNVVPVNIETMEFLGPFHRARLRAEALGDVHLTADFSANVVRDLDLAPGKSLPVRLPRERLRVFPGHS